MTSRLAAVLAVHAVALTLAACGSSTPTTTNVPVHPVPTGTTSVDPVDSTSPVPGNPGNVQPKPTGTAAATFGADTPSRAATRPTKFAQLGMTDATLITTVPAG